MSDAHDCGPYTPAHNNVMHGVIAIDNGTPRTERPDSSPYQFLVMSQNGWDVFEDVVAITGPSNDQVIKNICVFFFCCCFFKKNYIYRVHFLLL